MAIAALLAGPAASQINEITDFVKIFPSDPERAAFFGRSPVLHGSTPFVGSPWQDGDYEDQGVIYIFELLGREWIETSRLLNPYPLEISDMKFGNKMAFDEGRLVVGVPGSFIFSAVIVYEGVAGEWVDTHWLIPPPETRERFGFAVDIEGGTLMRGAHRLQEPVLAAPLSSSPTGGPEPWRTITMPARLLHLFIGTVTSRLLIGHGPIQRELPPLARATPQVQMRAPFVFHRGPRRCSLLSAASTVCSSNCQEARPDSRSRLRQLNDCSGLNSTFLGDEGV